MKKILIIIFLFLLVPGKAFAQETIESKIDELKDKVASRVAELKLVEKRGIIGEVQSTTDTQITISDMNGKTRFIDVDELTEFSSDVTDDSIGISDLKKGSFVSTLGLYNKESERLLARFVNEVNLPMNIHGVISAKDDEGFTVTLSTEDGENYIIDVERITRSFSFSKDELETSGFSQLEVGTNAVVTGFESEEEEKRITASRIVTFPETPKNPKVPLITNSPTVSPAE